MNETQRESIVTESKGDILASPDGQDSSHRLKHWEGSQTRLAFIKKELRRNERTKSELQEQALVQNFPHVTFNNSRLKGATFGPSDIEVAIKTKSKAQVQAQAQTSE